MSFIKIGQNNNQKKMTLHKKFWHMGTKDTETFFFFFAFEYFEQCLFVISSNAHSWIGVQKLPL